MSKTVAMIAKQIRHRDLTAVQSVEDCLARIATRNSEINAFTSITAERARRRAVEIDTRIARGEDVGPLAGVPFAAKDLFDIAGITTIAGSKILAANPPAKADAAAIAMLERAGAILVGALNMEELAYGFLTDNAHYGRTANPVDPARTAGGSSGGSGAAVAAGMVPLALGSDTNGSIRIPAAFCGAVGFKPTYGRIDRTGMTLLAPSQDHVGWVGSCVSDVASAWSVSSPRQTTPSPAHEPVIGVADGYFQELLSDDVRAALAEVSALFDAKRSVTIPEPDVARAAAYAITSSEASSLRMNDLKNRPQDFDPATRDRFLAGALLPAHWYIKAKCFRAWFQKQIATLFREVDVILMPANPFPAPRFGEEEIALDGKIHPVRPTIGRFTQPISPLGLPILCLPVARSGQLPIGMQLIAPPDSEAMLLKLGETLEKRLSQRS
ncbi:AtzE family amidohydrolase [Ferrovibrio sp.]|uniref:AtzE family amidohydrolase n=1 Tax=Ferrovibrio sp. TaxID=1917215 RepID=UPI0035B24D01